jgi:hypothetical protein
LSSWLVEERVVEEVRRSWCERGQRSPTHPNGATQAQALKDLKQEMGCSGNDLIVLLGNNTEAITVSKDPRHALQLKHVQSCHFWVRNAIKVGVVTSSTSPPRRRLPPSSPRRFRNPPSISTELRSALLIPLWEHRGLLSRMLRRPLPHHHHPQHCPLPSFLPSPTSSKSLFNSD